MSYYILCGILGQQKSDKQPTKIHIIRDVLRFEEEKKELPREI